MRIFRILLALLVAGATFYSLNALAVRNGYRDRLDFKNRHYHEDNCMHEHYKNYGFDHHNKKMADTLKTIADTSSNNKVLPFK